MNVSRSRRTESVFSRRTRHSPPPQEDATRPGDDGLQGRGAVCPHEERRRGVRAGQTQPCVPTQTRLSPRRLSQRRRWISHRFSHLLPSTYHRPCDLHRLTPSFPFDQQCSSSRSSSRSTASARGSHGPGGSTGARRTPTGR